MSLSGKQSRYLRSLGHSLAPIVQIGREGLSEGVMAAIEAAFDDHELIKLKVGHGSDLDRHNTAEELSRRTGADVAQVLGNTVLLYRAHPDKPVIVLPPRERDRPERGSD